MKDKKVIWIVRGGTHLKPIGLEVDKDFVKNMQHDKWYPTGLPEYELQYFNLKMVRLSKASANRAYKLKLQERAKTLASQLASVKREIRCGGMRIIKSGQTT